MENSAILDQRLFNEKLVDSQFKNVLEVVEWLGAVQSQDYTGAKWALGLRIPGSTDAQIEADFNAGKILRTHVMRPTWHFVSPKNIRWMLKLTAPRIRIVMGYYWRKVGLDQEILKKSYSLFEKTLKDNNYIPRPELADIFLQSKTVATLEQFNHLLGNAEIDGLICSGPRIGKQISFALLDERVPATAEISHEESLAKLAQIYFTSHGPATIQDFSWWSGLSLTDAKKAPEMVKEQFIHKEVNGVTFWFKESKKSMKRKSDVIHLLPNYDEFLVGFKERTAVLESIDNIKLDVRENVLFNHIIILNGRIVGGWKRNLTQKTAKVIPTFLTKLTKPQEDLFDQEVKRFEEFSVS